MDHHDHQTQSHQNTEQADSGKRAQLDFSAYMPLLKDVNISEEEKRELLRMLIAIAASFIELGIPLEVVWDACGKVEKSGVEASAALADHVKSTHQDIIEQFGSSAASEAEDAEEGVEA